MKPTEARKRLDALPWYSATSITPRAEELVQEHIRRMRGVFEHVGKTEQKPALEAYSDAQGAGYAADGHDELFDAIYGDVDFRGAPAKMPLVLTLVAHYCWKEDGELGGLADPWEPIVELFALGYTTTFDQDDETDTLDFVLEYPGSRKSYPLVGNGVPEGARS